MGEYIDFIFRFVYNILCPTMRMRIRTYVGTMIVYIFMKGFPL